MRGAIALLLPLIIAATPALAAPQPPQPSAEVQRALGDPAVADKLANVMQALSRALLDLPVGEVEAAVEGRPSTPADRQRRVRDVEPGIDADVQAQMAQAKPMIRQGMKALSDALPAMMKGLQEAQKSLERAAANMPDPTYPKR